MALLRQDTAPLWPLERHALATGAKMQPLVREVLLICQGRPWVFARTVMPRTTASRAGRYLTKLGTRPLGEALFRDSRVKRGQLTATPVKISDHSGTYSGWGRYSQFYINSDPLLVSEYFLSEYPGYRHHYDE